MKYLFVFLLVSMSSIVISQNRYHVDNTTFALNDTVLYLKYDMKPINGVLYNDIGDMGICVKGKKDGLWREYYENGQLWYEYNYKDGKRDGLYRQWYENGQLWYEINYKDDKQDGLLRQWYENGQLETENYYKDGKSDGLGRGWYTNGQLFGEYYYKDGKRDGLTRRWYQNGQLSREYYYKDGELISKRCFDVDGKLKKCD